MGVEEYPKFLAVRRKLMAQKVTSYLASLMQDEVYAASQSS